MMKVLPEPQPREASITYPALETTKQPEKVENTIEAAFERGRRSVQGLVKHFAPELGDSIWHQGQQVPITDDNVRDVHTAICMSAASNARAYFPREATRELSDAFEEGAAAAIKEEVSRFSYR